MGTDIHLAVEVRGPDGRWHRALPPEADRDPWIVEQAQNPAAFDPAYYRRRAEVTWYDDRNYDLFAMLADVRNGRGFAGIVTGEGFEVIAQPRGLPNDLSPEVRALSLDREEALELGLTPSDDNDVWLGDHSHSWLTLRELLEFDWEQRSKHRGYITLPEFAERLANRETGAPKSGWSGGVGGSQTVILDPDEAALRLRRGGVALAVNQHAYVNVEWVETYRESADRFLTRVVPALERLGGPDDVRIVFGFDS